MKKLLLVLSVLMLGIMLVGCDNSSEEDEPYQWQSISIFGKKE